MAQVAFSISFFISVALVILSRLYFNKRNDLRAVQACHVRPTSRLGGVAVGMGLCGALLLMPIGPDRVLVTVILCALPVFVAGLAEDAGWRVAPIGRLAAAICSSLLAILVFGIVIPRMGMGPLDAIVAHPFPALLVTALVLTGVTQAFNLVDGLHGLCGFASLITAGALAMIAIRTGQTEAVQGLWVLMGAVGGYLVLNYPRGLLFLGDAGAYVLGFVLACIAITMLQQVPDLSPWAVVLVFFWPLADMVMAVVRRMSSHRPSFHADRMHFHHVALRSLEILVLPNKSRTVSNPTATLILLPFMALPAALGVVYWNQNATAFALAMAAAVCFAVAYWGTVAAAKRRKRPLTGSKSETRTAPTDPALRMRP